MHQFCNLDLCIRNLCKTNDDNDIIFVLFIDLFKVEIQTYSERNETPADFTMKNLLQYNALQSKRETNLTCLHYILQYICYKNKLNIKQSKYQLYVGCSQCD